MCSEVKTYDRRVKWLLVTLGMINATSLALYLLIQILTSGSHLNANGVEPQLAVNSSPSTVSQDAAHAKASSVFRSPETTVVYPYKTKVKFWGYEFEFILRDLSLGKVHPLSKGESNIAHTCFDSLLDKGESLDKEEVGNLTWWLLENSCIRSP
ncbi:MAG: hypothetical protein ACI8RW_000069 [Porticoccaceae bacterium]|jgi:hypothetical protein